MTQDRDAGISALNSGDFSNAILNLESAVVQDPNDAEAMMYLGGAYAASRRHQDAVRVLTQAVELQPTNAQARFNLGVSLEQAGSPDQAAGAFQQALALQPSYPRAYEALKRLRPDATASEFTNPPPASSDRVTEAPVHEQPVGLAGYTSAPGPITSPLNSVPYGATTVPLGPQNYDPTTRPLGAMPSGSNYAPIPETRPALGIAVAVLVALACAVVFGNLMVGTFGRIPFLGTITGLIVGKSCKVAAREGNSLVGGVSAASAAGALLLMFYFIQQAGFRVNPGGYISVAIAGWFSWKLASE